jgi:hypothetical protein
MGEYIPQAPINDEAKQHNKELPGLGGVFNYVNLHAYHYAGNNPVKLTDPDGREDIVIFVATELQNVNNMDTGAIINSNAYHAGVSDKFILLKQAAEEKGLSVKVISGTDATKDNLLAAYSDDETKRLIVIAHGSKDGSIADSFNVDITSSDFAKATKGKKLEQIDLIACYANNGNNAQDWAKDTEVRINTYNRTGNMISFFGTNYAVSNLISSSIKIDNPTFYTARNSFIPKRKLKGGLFRWR